MADKKFKNVIATKLRFGRNAYFLAVFMTILLGLASRKFSHVLPVFLAENAGDALWAMMVYYGFRFLLIQRGRFFSFCLSVLFSFSIEFSQIYQANWINVVRDTMFGALILGKGFLFVDLVRYAVGIFIAYEWDKRLARYTKH